MNLLLCFASHQRGLGEDTLLHSETGLPHRLQPAQDPKQLFNLDVAVHSHTGTIRVHPPHGPPAEWAESIALAPWQRRADRTA